MQFNMNQLQTHLKTIQKVSSQYQLPNPFHEPNMARYANCDHIVTSEGINAH